jgi:3-oxoacyl-[acyl-carrier-protein] synthase II
VSPAERRVAVTGIGLVTPLGVGTTETWTGLIEGRGAVGPIAAYDATSLRTQVGAEVSGMEPKKIVPNRRALRTMTRYDVLAMVAATLAMNDSGLEPIDDPQGRAALFTAGGKEISEPEHFEDVAVAVRDEHGDVDMRKFGEIASSSVHPLFFIEGLQGASLFYVSEAYGLRGANTYVAGTAEAGLGAIGCAFRSIRRGESDVAVAGGADAPVCWWNMAKIDSVGLTTRAGAVRPYACRPYDEGRDGTAMGEGGAFVVLEELEAAQRRGARVYAEVTGFGSSADVERLITPEPSGAALAAAVGRALADAGRRADAIGYVAGHGSGTRQGDASEGRGLGAAFGADRPLGSSVKAACGHLGAAAGALNFAVAALAVHHRVVPPTLNLTNPDPVCATIDWVADEAREAPIREAMALARGLEGQNVALAVRAPV